MPRARRRHFTNADKRRILQAADRCTQPGEIGALMRREGVYSRGSAGAAELPASPVALRAPCNAGTSGKLFAASIAALD